MSMEKIHKDIPQFTKLQGLQKKASYIEFCYFCSMSAENTNQESYKDIKLHKVFKWRYQLYLGRKVLLYLSIFV